MIDQAQAILGYTFRNPQLLVEALTHASSADHRLKSNERMEFLGDAVLGFVVSEFLYQRFPTYEEGDLTKLKSAAVSRKVCAQVSEVLDLGSVLSVGKGMSSQRRRLPGSIAAAVLEAVIAAIYFDGGLEPARVFILRHFGPVIEELDLTTHQHNFKSVLQQHAQKSMTGNPNYVLLDEKGPDHAKCFEVCVEIAGRRFGAAWANSKKEAEQVAALRALQDLDLATVTDSGHILLDTSLMTRKSQDPK